MGGLGYEDLLVAGQLGSNDFGPFRSRNLPVESFAAKNLTNVTPG